MDKEIFDLRSERKKLENEIRFLLQTFERNTGFKVIGFSLTRDKDSKNIDGITIKTDIGREGENYDPSQETLEVPIFDATIDKEGAVE